MLFLSIFGLLATHFMNSPSLHVSEIDCHNSKTKDSLIAHYLENGAHKYNYNSEIWQIYCDSLIAICPNIPYAYQQKAMPLIKRGDYAQAYANIDKAVDLEPHTYLPYRGFLKCIFSKDYVAAIADFTESQRINKNAFEMDHSYFFYIGLSHLALGNYSEAEKNLLQDIAIQIKGRESESAHFNSLFYIGLTYLEQKNYAQAESYLLKSLDAYSQMPETNYYLAKCYELQNQPEKQKKYLEKAKFFIEKGYKMNEDNEYYTNYPYQITLFEVEKDYAK